MTTTTRIVLALGLGIVVGLFVGERAAPLGVVAEAYVRLLQMAVLPYLTVSLIAGIGSLDAPQAGRLFLRVGALTLAVWALALGAVLMMPLAFPELEAASFFSTTMVETRAPIDFLALYIPSNPFHSLANSVVPAVVLFSAVLGVALMGLQGKEKLIEWLVTVERALSRANHLVGRLTPIGLFAIAAHAGGTADFEEVARLRVYQIAYSAMALLLALWVLPGLVACLTPIPVRRILQANRDAFITAFMTADLFIVLPTLIERAKGLLREHGQDVSAEGAAPDVIVPAFYNFPHAAKLLSLSFILFAAWYSETPLTAGDYSTLMGAGIVSLFGSTSVALPFLLDLVRVPADTFQLFLATGVLNSRFAALVGASHMVVLALAGSYALTGGLRVSGRRILRYAAVTTGLATATVGGLAVTLRALGPNPYQGAQRVQQMRLLRTPAAPATLLDALPALQEAPTGEGATLVDAVRARGRLRVGYLEGRPPFSFTNAGGELVGFDVEMAYTLAAELGLSLELVPVTLENLDQALEGRCDLAVGGIFVTTRRAAHMAFSPPYLDETFAFVVPDHLRADFSDAAAVRSRKGLRLAVPSLPYFLEFARREFPMAEIVPVLLEDMDALLSAGLPGVDALCLTAERGSFLALLHPAFSVAVPHPLQARFPLSYPVALRDPEMVRLLGTWLDLKRKDGTIQSFYDHWILGRDAKARRPRWSVLEDVLHVGS
jgi:Na+/H+-dicarboxylate symporter/ABC-type amino acid transport substrate-binding protein